MLASVSFSLSFFIYFLYQVKCAAGFERDILQLLSKPFTSNTFPSSDGLMRPARPVSWENCGQPTDLFRFDFLELNPDPPRRSSPLTVHLQGYLKETLDQGVVEYEVKFGGFKLATGSLDGCPALANEPNLPQCPVKAGPIDVTHTVELPWHVPPGRYLINAKGKRSADGKQIFCINLDIAIDLVNGDQF